MLCNYERHPTHYIVIIIEMEGHSMINVVNELTKLAMTIVSTPAGAALVPRINCRPRGGWPVLES